MSDIPTPITDKFLSDQDFSPTPSQCLNFAASLEIISHAAKSAVKTLQADVNHMRDRITVQTHEIKTLREQVSELEESALEWFIAAQELANALRECKEDSIELLGERADWKDSPGGGYQRRYLDTKENIIRAYKALDALSGTGKP